MKNHDAASEDSEERIIYTWTYIDWGRDHHTAFGRVSNSEPNSEPNSELYVVFILSSYYLPQLCSCVVP